MKKQDAAGQGPDLAAFVDRLVPPATEAAYERLAGYGFARRHVSGKTVADLCWQEMGHGSRLLAETAASVAAMSVSAEAAEVASKAAPAPNVGYEAVDFAALPYPEGHFDVVVALGLIEKLDQPETLLSEARRVLKEDGTLVLSFPGGRSWAEREIRGELDRLFGEVRSYRLAAVSGGAVFPGGVDAATLEGASFSPFSPDPGPELPPSSSVIAVCGGGESEDAPPYLVLDRDRRVFDESADRAEEIDGLRREIEDMQRTEVQVFRDSLKLRNSEISYLRAEIRRLRRSEAEVRALRERIKGMENSTTWRIFEPYRRLRARIGRARGSAPGVGKGAEDR